MKRFLFLPFLVFVLCLSACEDLREPEFKQMQEVKFKSVNLRGDLKLKAEAVFHNPNSLGVDISGVQLDVYIEGNRVARVNQDLDAEMKPKADFTLPLTIDVPVEKVVKDLGSTVGSILKNKGSKVRMVGTLKVKVMDNQFSVPIEYEEEHKLPLNPLSRPTT